MKKRINIQVQPVDNGYTIQANVADHPSGQHSRSVNLVAQNESQVVDHVAEFMAGAFKEPGSATGSPASSA